MQNKLESSIRKEDLDLLFFFKNKSTLLSHVELGNAQVIFERNKNFPKRDDYLNLFLTEISTKHLDSKGWILRDYFIFFEKLFFQVEKISIKNNFYIFLVNFYVNKSSNKKISKEKLFKLQEFMSKDFSEKEIKVLEKIKKKTILDLLLFFLNKSQ
ncbi:MAG: hypothetical protein KBD12_00855 [Candidatus Pacebacteria bacterium]|nr:hypothetical protein [Candidatus Paceibacterota bacterium]